MPTFVDSIQEIPFTTDQYVDQVFKKIFIVLHHTASDANPFGVASWWLQTVERVGTAFIIAGKANTTKKWVDGGIFQCFNSSNASWHLGTTQKDLDRGKPGNATSTFLNMNSIGIELCNFGFLVEKGQSFVSYTGAKIPDNEIEEFKTAFRGYHYYHKYTDAQLESCQKLIIYLADKYSIPQKYVGMKLFDICPDAIRGVPAVWSHVNFRVDKYDLNPQKNLISMLETL